MFGSKSKIAAGTANTQRLQVQTRTWRSARVTQAHRQPGSAFKPFVYLAALEHGISPWDWREDLPVDIAGYQPANYRDVSYGRLRLIDALARSVNTITVNLAQEVGVAQVSLAARRLGISSPLQNNASLALGTNEVTPLELTAAYATFANGGKLVEPHLVSAITDAEGKLVYQRQEPVGTSVMSDEIRRDMTEMLCNVIESGTGTAARLPGREAGGKTGTTQDYRDAWFIGFTAGHVAGVWIGNDDNTPTHNVTGGTVPAQMWKAVMLAAEANMPAIRLQRSPPPPGAPQPEDVIGTAYRDNPLPRDPIVDPSQTGAGSRGVLREESPAVIASAPATTQAIELSRRPQTTAALPPVQGVIVRVPNQAETLPPPIVQRETVAPLPHAPSYSAPTNPTNGEADQQAAIAEQQDREAEYRRVWRQTVEPGLSAEASGRPGSIDDRVTPPADAGIPFPAPRERAQPSP